MKPSRVAAYTWKWPIYSQLHWRADGGAGHYGASETAGTFTLPGNAHAQKGTAGGSICGGLLAGHKMGQVAGQDGP
jgi:hypothetical protein